MVLMIDFPLGELVFGLKHNDYVRLEPLFFSYHRLEPSIISIFSSIENRINATLTLSKSK